MASAATEESKSQDPKITQSNEEESTKSMKEDRNNGEDEDDDEEVGECGFCVFMKGGGCRDSFIAWEECVEQGEKSGEDIAERCFNVTAQLKKCMEAHSDYYKTILDMEQAIVDAAEDAVANEKEDETESKKDDEAIAKENKRSDLPASSS